MKYVKILGLLAVAATALMAFAGSASADQVSTTTGGAAATPTIHMVNDNSAHVTIANSIANIQCAVTLEGTVSGHGVGKGAGEIPVTGNISKLVFSSCTDGWTVLVQANGSFSISSTSGHNGTVSFTGSTTTAVRHTILGTVECRYSTNATHIGTLTGGSPATLKIEGKLPFHSGGGLCDEGAAQMGGSLVTTSALYVAKS